MSKNSVVILNACHISTHIFIKTISNKWLYKSVNIVFISGAFVNDCDHSVQSMLPLESALGTSAKMIRPNLHKVSTPGYSNVYVVTRLTKLRK
jgi:hypothetical protein